METSLIPQNLHHLCQEILHLGPEIFLYTKRQQLWKPQHHWLHLRIIEPQLAQEI